MKAISFIFYCFCYKLVLCVDPTVRITETVPDVTEGKIMLAKRGQDVTMSCFVENKQQGSEVRWQRTYIDSYGKEQTEPISKDQAVDDNTRFGIEKPTMFTWRLRIRAIPIAYEGTYRCYVQVQLQIKAFEERVIIVYVPPTLIPERTSSDMTVEEGDTFDLMCDAIGVPKPMIEWSRQGRKPLPVGKEKAMGERLTVTNIQYHHRGLYRCVASNIIGTVTRNIEVKVKFRPKVKAVYSVVKQAQGYVTVLQCIVEANPNPSREELSWYKGAVTMSRTSGRFQVSVIQGAFNRLTFELRIDGVRSEDYGTYSCQAGNNFGLSSDTVQLQEVSVPQRSVKLGIVIKSAASSQYPATVTMVTALLASLLISLRR